MTVKEIMDFRQDAITSKLGVVTRDVPSLLALNWAAPCMVPIHIQDNQISVLSWALSENMQSAAVVINPVFTYSKGKLNLEEQKPVDLLAKGNHNLDWQFSILFKEKTMTATSAPWCTHGGLSSPLHSGALRRNCSSSVS